jgi:hypothetical protein
MTRNRRFYDKMPLYKQDLVNIQESVPIRYPVPYHLTEPWDQSIDIVFQLLRQGMAGRNRITTLVYAYYLGELLDMKTLPRFAWLEYVQQHDITNEYYFYLGITRTYKVFKDDRDQIYRTNHLSFWVIARMSKDNFNNNFMPFAQSIKDMLENIRS